MASTQCSATGAGGSESNFVCMCCTPHLCKFILAICCNVSTWQTSFFRSFVRRFFVEVFFVRFSLLLPRIAFHILDIVTSKKKTTKTLRRSPDVVWEFFPNNRRKKKTTFSTRGIFEIHFFFQRRIVHECHLIQCCKNNILSYLVVRKSINNRSFCFM